MYERRQKGTINIVVKSGWNQIVELRCGVSFKEKDESRIEGKSFTKPKSISMIEGQKDSEAGEVEKGGERTP